jgi:hypothetical protein
MCTQFKKKNRFFADFCKRVFLHKKIHEKPTQWKNISITSMEVDFWEVKSNGCGNSYATEVICSNIPQKS